MARTLKRDEKYYNQLLDIIIDELNVKQVRLCNGNDEDDKEISLVYNGNKWYWIHGEERKEVKNREIILKACDDLLSKE